MNNHQREILALRYLSALQNRDLDTLAVILAHAETDDVLETMIREIHAEDQTVWQEMHTTSNGQGTAAQRLAATSIGSQPQKEHSDMTATTLTMSKPRMAVPWTMVAAAITILLVGALLLFSTANFDPSHEPVGLTTGYTGQGAPTDPVESAQPAATEDVKTFIAIGLGDLYTQESTLTIPIETELVNLDVQTEFGEVRIEAADGPVDAITVDITRRVWASSETEAEEFMAALGVTALRDGDLYQVIVSSDKNVWKHPGPMVDLIITVPQMVNVNSKSEIGSVVLTGITAPDYVSVEAALGAVELRSVTVQGNVTIEADLGDVSLDEVVAETGLMIVVETGQITLDQVTSPDHTELDVQAGDIQVLNLLGEGSLIVTAQLGAVKITDAQHLAQVNVRAELGDLHFAGVIAGAGEYEFSVDLGNIDITAQAGSAFSFDAEVGTGLITSELSGSEVDYDHALIGMSAQGTLQTTDDGASATVTVTCEMGNVTIHD